MSPTHPPTGHTSAAAPRDEGGALPFTGPSGRFFAAHAAISLAVLLWMHHTIAEFAPEAVKQIGTSYQIQYYHVPSAIASYVFYLAASISAVCLLMTRSAVWDRRCRALAATGLVANAIVLVTGSIWGKTAWNTWWDWNDPRLLSSAIMFLVWLGLPMLSHAARDDDRRPRFTAVFAICGSAVIPFVHYAPKWFGVANHPAAVSQKDPRIGAALLLSMAALHIFYLLVYRYVFDRMSAAERAEDALARIRRLEESR